ncbi:hypothetical protein [Metabacillus fastidiosus]|uniref:hypothetical protein n=1 Tax=Metabacillus fastidiosus TaxID=1458 RepID=UPI003D2C2F3D
MGYYDNQQSVANIAVGLMDKGWKVYGYRADESDAMTDYFSPASWSVGIAEKDGYILLVDVYGTHNSGYKVTKNTYTPDFSKIEKLRATINDAASSENEKEASQKIIDNMMNKQKESTTIIEEYPTFKNANPKGCNWHIEKDGNIIAKGKGAFQCDGYLFGGYREETMEKVNAFINRIEKHIEDNTQLVAVTKKVIKKVTKPVELKINLIDFKVNGTIIKLNCGFTGGHYQGELLQLVEVYTYGEKTRYSFVKLGKKYQQLKRYGAANNTLVLDSVKLENWLNDGSISTMELKEVEEVTEKIVYKKAKRDNSQKENLLQGETVEEVKTEVTDNQEANIETKEVNLNNNNDKIKCETGTGAKGNGIEITFTSKPSEEVRNSLKAVGFRWGGKKRPSIWWAVMDEDNLSLVKLLAGEELQEESKEETTEDENIYNNDDVLKQEETIDNDLYNNKVTETPTGFYCHFKEWNLDIDYIEKLLNDYNIPFYIAGDKFIFEGVSHGDLSLIEVINEANQSILWDDSYKHDELIKDIEESKNSYIAEMENARASELDFDLQYFASTPTEEDILSAFDDIDLVQGNNSVISEDDRAYCEQLEKQFNEVRESYNNFEQQLRALGNDNSFVDSHRDFYPIEDRLKKLCESFVYKFARYFNEKYNIKIDSYELIEKYNINVSADDLINELVEQLDGLNFNEKAEQEIKQEIKDVISYKDIKVNNNKVTIDSFFYCDDFSLKWYKAHRVSYNSHGNFVKLFKALSHFMTGKAELTQTFKTWETKLTDRENEDITKVHEIHYEHLETIKLFKNGRIDIQFTSKEHAKKFYNEYLQR